jgi:inner membrane protein
MVMASAFSHAFVAVAFGGLFRHPVMTRRALLLGAFCAVLPDIDVIGFGYGVGYGDLWGHRGLTHSLLFALLLSLLIVALCYRRESRPVMAGMTLYFFLATASHATLDALTNGGLGVAFFSPVDPTRYFFPVRPIEVSPIGIGEFFSAQGWLVARSELLWIWLPTLVLFFLWRALPRL